MPRGRSLRARILGALGASLLGCALLVGAGLAAPTTSDPDLSGYFPPGNGLTVNAFVDAASQPGKTLYRFDTVILNSATAGVLDLYKPSGSNTAFQSIWATGLPPTTPIGKGDVPTGSTLRNTGASFAYSPASGHNHWHFPNAAAYQLLTAASAVVTDSPKNLAGFCLYDSWNTPGNPVFFSDGTYCRPNLPSYTGVIRMGIAPGKGDFYGNELADQWVEVQDVEPRTDYRLSMRVNPLGLIQESNTANNLTTTPATIVVPGGRAAPASATTPAGQAVQIALPGEVIGASVRSRATATCDLGQPSCYRTAVAGQLTYAIATAPPAGQGSVTIAGSTATFTPAAGFSGSTSFSYRATDSRGLAGPPATVSVTVTGSGPGVTVAVAPASASVQISTTRQFTATLTGGSGAVVWSVNGVNGGNATVGTVSATGLYTAPAAVPAAAVSVRATHAASGAFGQAAVTVTGSTPPPAPRDPNALPLVDSFTGADAGPPLGPLWSGTPIWSGQRLWKRSSNQAAPSGSGWNDSYLSAAVGRPVGIRMQITTPPASGQVVFAWLVSSGLGASPTGYTLRMQRGTTTDSFQIQRWANGSATFLAGTTSASLPAGGWISLIADATGVQGFTSANGTTWTSAGISTDTTLTGNLRGGLESNSTTVRVNNVGYGSLDAGPPPPVTVAVAPTTASVQTGATRQFTATVTGTSDPVVWSVNGVSGGNATVGTVSATGLYTAPAAVPAGAVTVRATHAASTTFGEAAVTVTAPPPVTVSVSPATASVQTGAGQQFTATVSGTSDPVVWSVNGVERRQRHGGHGLGDGALHGARRRPRGRRQRARHPRGLGCLRPGGGDGHRAPPPPVTVSVAPASASVQISTTRQFTATLTGGSGAVVWSVNGVDGGNATVGTVSATGLYTAPAAVPAAAVSVRATHAASGAFGQAAVTVTGSTPPPAPRDPNALPLVDSFTGADAGPPLGPLWSGTPIWSGQRLWKRSSNQAAPSGSGWNDSYLSAAVGRPVGIRMQITTPPASGQVVFAWLVSSGLGASPTGYTLRMQRGTTTDSFQIQRWANGSATFLAGTTSASLPAGGWISLIADATGVQGFTSANGTTWTSAGISTDTTLTGNLRGGLESNSTTVRVDNVGYGSLGP